jgi:hypothetical protein
MELEAVVQNAAPAGSWPVILDTSGFFVADPEASCASSLPASMAVRFSVCSQQRSAATFLSGFSRRIFVLALESDPLDAASCAERVAQPAPLLASCAAATAVCAELADRIGGSAPERDDRRL